jgi:hypothetical protein
MDWQRQLDERPAPPDIALESLMSISSSDFLFARINDGSTANTAHWFLLNCEFENATTPFLNFHGNL